MAGTLAGAAGSVFAQAPLAPAESYVADQLQKLVLPLVVNGTPREPVAALIQDKDIWLAVADIENAGLLPGKIPQQIVRSLRGAAHFRLRDASMLLAYRFDEAELSLSVDLNADVMAVNSISLAQARATRSEGGQYAPAMYLNYSINGAQGSRASIFAESAISLRGHTLQAYFTHDAEGRSYRGPVSLFLNNEAARRQLVLGDSQWTGSGLLGSVPLGGITVQSFFSYEPGFISTPTMDLRGYAATPSTVDVLVNGALVGQRQLPAGPFELGNIVAQAGQNNVVAVVRDAFGRESRINGDTLYGSPTLLSPGLVTYSASIGRLREDRAGAGPAYGTPVVMAQAAVGIDNSLTLGAAAQLSRDVKAIAGQLAATGNWGELGVQAAQSHSASGNGLALAMSYRISTPVWGLNAALTRRQPAFAELSSTGLLADRTLQTAEFGLGRRLFDLDWGLRLTETRSTLYGRARRLSLSASRRWTERLFTIFELARSTGQTNDTSIFLLASYTLDAEHSTSLATSRASGQLTNSIDLTKTPQEALSTGYRLNNTWAADGSRRQFAQLSRDTTFGDYQVQASQAGAERQASWRASGALVAMDGTVAATPPIRDAFALVRVPGAPQVPVRVEGRFVGNTDARGELLVPSLGAYSSQRISIDTEALPLDYEVGEVERRVSPPMRGGEIVQFDVKVYRAATGRLTDASGQPITSAVLVLADGRRVATGTSGDFVIEGDPPKGVARVERPNTLAPLCSIRFAPLPEPPKPVLRLGELRCAP